MKASNTSRVQLTARDRVLERIALAMMSLVVLLVGGSSCRRPLRSSIGTHSVHATQVSELTSPVEFTTTGEVIPSLVHSITAPFTGEVRAVYCREGQDVSKGQLLFTIGAFRRERFLGRKPAALEDGWTLPASCPVYSHVNGRVIKLQVQAGGAVQMKDPRPLITIQQLTPVFVRFQMPKQYLGQIMNNSRAGKLTVQTFTDADEAHKLSGKLNLINSTAHETQKEIEVSAIFSNLDKTLHPGKPVNIVLTLARQPKMILIPAEALRTRDNAQSVLVIRPDQTLELRPVAVSRRMEHEVVIEQGLKTGEWIVAEQQPNLYAGEHVVLHPQTSMIDIVPQAQE